MMNGYNEIGGMPSAHLYSDLACSLLSLETFTDVSRALFGCFLNSYVQLPQPGQDYIRGLQVKSQLWRLQMQRFFHGCGQFISAATLVSHGQDWVASKGWRLLPAYSFCVETGEWHHRLSSPQQAQL